MEKIRISKLIDLTKEDNLDFIVVVYPPNLKYLTGFRGDNGALVIYKNDEQVLLTDGRYVSQAEEEVTCCKVEEFRSVEDLLIRKFNGKRIGIDGIGFSFSRFSKLKKLGFSGELLDISEKIYLLRAKKDQGEISLIKKSIEIQENVLKKVAYEKLWEKNSEKKLANKILCMLLEEGAEKESFETIVAYDSNSALPHAIPEDREFAGDVVLIDWGAVWKGYHSDQTITIIDQKNSHLKKIYDVVKNAQNIAIENIKPGISAATLDKIARDYIAKAGYGDFFKHSLGHGVGLEIHERPFIGLKSEDIIEEGMVFTIEPGIYIPGIGGVRLEDMVLVTANGYQKLTQIDK